LKIARSIVVGGYPFDVPETAEAEEASDRLGLIGSCYDLVLMLMLDDCGEGKIMIDWTSLKTMRDCNPEAYPVALTALIAIGRLTRDLDRGHVGYAGCEPFVLHAPDSGDPLYCTDRGDAAKLACAFRG
jgi:hypothetical protein